MTGSRRVRALGSRHSFNEVAATDGTLVSLHRMPTVVDVDSERQVVRVSGATRFGELGTDLARQGLALANTGSLPHISVAGTVATGTHGSGRTNRVLAAGVRALHLMGADGEVSLVSRDTVGDAFDGSVLALGRLGIVTEARGRRRADLRHRPDRGDRRAGRRRRGAAGGDAVVRLQRQRLHPLRAGAQPGVGQAPRAARRRRRRARGRRGARPGRRPVGWPDQRRRAAPGRGRRHRCRVAAGSGCRGRGTSGCRTSGWSSPRASATSLQTEYLLPISAAPQVWAGLMALRERLAPLALTCEPAGDRGGPVVAQPDPGRRRARRPLHLAPADGRGDARAGVVGGAAAAARGPAALGQGVRAAGRAGRCAVPAAGRLPGAGGRARPRGPLRHRPGRPLARSALVRSRWRGRQPSGRLGTAASPVRRHSGTGTA
nr:FAD-binding protein [Angustibacter aerolatus]